MTKITRKDQQIFASTAGDEAIAKFGSLAAGNPGFSTDPDEIQTDEYKGGWQSGVIGQASPTMEDRNSLDFLFSRQLGYLYQQGIAEYSATQTYYKGSIVSNFDADDETLKLYYSLADNNTGNALDNDTYWAEFKSGGGASLPLLTFQFTDHELNDVSWVKSNFSWLSGSVYLAAYKHLQADVGFRYASSTLTVSHPDFTAGTYVRISALDKTIDTTDYYAWGISGTTEDTKCVYTLTTTLADGVKTYFYKNSAMQQLTSCIVEGQSETIGGTTISYFRAQDGHKIVLDDQATNVASIYSATGVAWYYIFDDTNTQFKLPRSNWNFKGTSNDDVGDFVDQSLPNFTTDIAFRKYAYNVGPVASVTGAGTFDNYGYPQADEVYANANATIAYQKQKVTIDPSAQVSIYQNDANVQEKATKAYLYFYVGNFEQTAIEQTAGLAQEDFLKKADTDLGNITEGGKLVVTNLVSPSTYNVDITLKASGQTYTAPADGWFTVSGTAAGAGYAVIMTCNYVVTSSRAVGVNSGIWCSIYCGKGDTMSMLYDGFDTLDYFKFVYAKGCEPQS